MIYLTAQGRLLPRWERWRGRGVLAESRRGTSWSFKGRKWRGRLLAFCELFELKLYADELNPKGSQPFAHSSMPESLLNDGDVNGRPLVLLRILLATCAWG